jgi:hypothetical protein
MQNGTGLNQFLERERNDILKITQNIFSSYFNWQSELNFFRQYKQPNIIVQLYSISGPED